MVAPYMPHGTPASSELSQHVDPASVNGAVPLAEADLQLIVRGYEPVACVGKRPLNDGWRTRPNTIEAITADRAAMPAATNTGLRTGKVVGIDIDVAPAEDPLPGYDNPDHAPLFVELVQEVLGYTMMQRVGKKGAMLVYRNATPIGKIKIIADHPVFTKPLGRAKPDYFGQKPRAPRPHQAAVEILGTGQQFVALGIHPDTDRPYEWTYACIGGDPLQTACDELGEVTPEQLRSLADRCKALFEQLGYVNVRITEVGKYAKAWEAKRRQDNTPVPLDYLRRMVATIDMTRFDGDRDRWIAFLGGLRATCLRDVDPGDMDRVLCDIADEASSRGAGYEGRADVEANFYSLTADRAGGSTFGSLYHWAREAGWSEPPPQLSMAERHAERVGAGHAPQPGPKGKLRLRRGSMVNPKPISWLWQGWLALGKLHILGGHKGAGKSTTVFDWFARITRGDTWPDGSAVIGGPGRVLIWSSEDDFDDTILPRFIAAGGDREMIESIGGIENPDGSERPFDPAKDIVALLETIRDLPDLRAIMVDPIVSAVAGDGNSNNDVRRALQPLVDLAAERGIAVIGITHFSKNTQGKTPIERITGSLAYGAISRIAMAAVKPENDNDPRRLVRIAANISREDGGGFEYRLHTVNIKGDESEDIETSRVEWGAVLTGPAAKLLGELEEGGDQSELQQAMAWLRRTLENSHGGMMLVEEVFSTARAEGHSRATVYRAKALMGNDIVIHSTTGAPDRRKHYWKIDCSMAARGEEARRASEEARRTHFEGGMQRMAEAKPEMLVGDIWI